MSSNTATVITDESNIVIDLKNQYIQAARELQAFNKKYQGSQERIEKLRREQNTLEESYPEAQKAHQYLMKKVGKMEASIEDIEKSEKALKELEQAILRGRETARNVEHGFHDLGHDKQKTESQFHTSRDKYYDSICDSYMDSVVSIKKAKDLIQRAWVASIFSVEKRGYHVNFDEFLGVCLAEQLEPNDNEFTKYWNETYEKLEPDEIKAMRLTGNQARSKI